MSLDIGAALRRGFDDLTSETGLLVVAVLVLYNLGNLVATQSFSSELLDVVFASGAYTEAQQQAIASFAGTFPFALELGLALATVLALSFVLVGELVRFWAIRSFAGPSETAVGSAAERAGMALVLGGGVALLLFGLGSVAPTLGQMYGPLGSVLGSLVGSVGSLVLLTVFVYLRQEIALNDGGYGETVRDSFARFMDDPGSIVVLLILLGLLGLVASVPTFLTVFLGVGPVAGVDGRTLLSVVSTVLNAVFQGLGIAAVTAAYLQVRASAADAEV